MTQEVKDIEMCMIKMTYLSKGKGAHSKSVTLELVRSGFSLKIISEAASRLMARTPTDKETDG